MTDGVVLGWGYEGKTVDDLLDALRAHAIDTVVDVRLTPISRKQGFSKTRLREACASAGVAYLHLRALGNPKDNRSGFAHLGHAGREARERYRHEVLAGDEATHDLHDITKRRDGGQRLLLLCFEDSEKHCHRSEVMQALPLESLARV